MPLRLLLVLLSLAPAVFGQERSARLEESERKEYYAVVTRCLTWLTGGSEENDYVSVGRLANYFGFVYFRISSSHSVNRSGLGYDVLHALPTEKAEVFFSLLEAQRTPLQEVRAARLK
ncbi:MAG: hypothetical protein AAF368_13685, partial [Planctomycetota bacterium]